jgi:hypothetical protein
MRKKLLRLLSLLGCVAICVVCYCLHARRHSVDSQQVTRDLALPPIQTEMRETPVVPIVVQHAIIKNLDEPAVSLAPDLLVDAIPPDLPHTEETKIQLLRECRQIRQDWDVMNQATARLPRIQWEREASNFRARHAPRLAQISKYFGAELPLRHPSDAGAYRDPPVPVGAGGRAGGISKLNPQVQAFAIDRERILKEKKEILAQVESQPEPVRMKVIQNWETEHAQRLAAHRKVANDLGQEDFEVMELEELAQAQMPPQLSTAPSLRRPPTNLSTQK